MKNCCYQLASDLFALGYYGDVVYAIETTEQVSTALAAGRNVRLRQTMRLDDAAYFLREMYECLIEVSYIEQWMCAVITKFKTDPHKDYFVPGLDNYDDTLGFAVGAAVHSILQTL